MTDQCFLWLTLRLMKKQKLRTAALFGGILFSSFLLHTFCGLGWYFWIQVHGPSAETAAFDSSQRILTALAALLLILVFSCSAVVVHNLLSLTFTQRWQSLRRLMTLGAARKDILFMTAAEISILSAAAVPLGQILMYPAAECAGLHLHKPLWMTCCIDIWLFVLSCFLILLPVLRAVGRPLSEASAASASVIRRHSFCMADSAGIRSARRNTAGSARPSFTLFMHKKYHEADRRRHFRITLTITAAVILYVPAGYLISTNLKMDQEGLRQKHGIEYFCIPADYQELCASLNECRQLISTANHADSVLYINASGTAFIPSGLLSSELLTVLKKAGWPGYEQLTADSDIYFLEDTCYDAYIQSHSVQTPTASDSRISAVLVNRCINRTAFAKDADTIFPETPLLNMDAAKAADIKICCGIQSQQADTPPYIYPDVCFDEFPEGIRAGNITLILPLSSFADVCEDMKNDWEAYSCHIRVCGLFEDPDAALFQKLQEKLGDNPDGKLTYTRREYQKWYDSLHEIHLAVTSVSCLLFFTALLSIFATMLFHCMQRRHETAVLWSLGQTQQSLTAILALETLHSFLYAVLTGIPVSGMLCYFIYRIYRRVWNIGFTLPYLQFLLILSAAALTSAAAAAAAGYILSRQDYLKELRNIL